MDEKEKKYFFDNPRNIKAIIYAVFALCAVVLAFDLIVHRHVEHSVESWFGFYAFYGFVCCFFLVIAATWMRKLVMRKEDYYDE